MNKLKQEIEEAKKELIQVEEEIKELIKDFPEPNTGSEFIDFGYKLEKLIDENNYPELIRKYNELNSFIARAPQLLKEEKARIARMKMMTKIGSQFSDSIETSIEENKKRWK